jgi:hypothetical protein
MDRRLLSVSPREAQAGRRICIGNRSAATSDETNPEFAQAKTLALALHDPFHVLCMPML